MPKISDKISRSLKEYVIQTGVQRKDTSYKDIDLSVELVPNQVVINYPFIAAGMGCVTDYDLTLECARNGMIADVPCCFPTDYQADIVKRVKEKEVRRGDIEFVDDPEMINIDNQLEEAFRLYKETGHSTIPIVDRFSNLLGIFTYQEGVSGKVMKKPIAEALADINGGDSRLRKIITPFDMDSMEGGIDYFLETDDGEYMHERMNEKGIRSVPIVDTNGRLMKLAFIYKYFGYMVGGAIHTWPGWEDRAKALVNAGADVIFIDASDCKSDYQVEVIKRFKKLYPDKPLCAGNGIDREGYDMCIVAGADMFKGGMGSGGSCITTSGRGVGRGLATALQAINEANNGKVPFFGDGGIGTKTIKVIEDVETDFGRKPLKFIEHDPGNMAKALAWAPWGIMMGSGFNILQEAAGHDFEYQGNRFKHRWGEGSDVAHTLARYGIGEDINRADVAEGIDDYVRVVGRLKPCMERNALNLRMTLANVGAKNLQEFSDKVVLELMSPEAMKEAGV
jgi:IMP dehydrogenase